MRLKRLIEIKDDSISRGSVFRVPAQWPYESWVDFMVVSLPDRDSQHALIVSSGHKAGLLLVRLPLEGESSKGSALSTKWVIANWKKWIYPECAVEDVLFLDRYAIENAPLS